MNTWLGFRCTQCAQEYPRDTPADVCPLISRFSRKPSFSTTLMHMDAAPQRGKLTEPMSLEKIHAMSPGELLT